MLFVDFNLNISNFRTSFYYNQIVEKKAVIYNLFILLSTKQV